MINVVLIVAILIIVAGAVNGWRRGFIKSIFSTFSLIVSIVLAVQAMPYIADYLADTQLYTMVYNGVEGIFDDRLTQVEEDVSQQTETINELEILPDALKDMLISNNSSDIYDALGITQFSEYVASSITSLIMNGISFLLAFLIIYIIIRLIGKALDLISRLPVLHSFNKIGGLLFGLFNGVVHLWIVFVIVTIFSGTEIGQYILVQINQSEILSYLYNNNYLLTLIQ